MKYSKHLKPGMSMLEVIVAIAILAIFGSSIFMMQQYLFDRIMISQKKLSANLRMQQELIAYQTNILKNFFEQKQPVEKGLQEQVKDFSHPDMKIRISTKSDLGAKEDDKDLSFKNLKNLHVIHVQAEQDFDSVKTSSGMAKNYGSSYLFVYIPEVAKK